MIFDCCKRLLWRKWCNSITKKHNDGYVYNKLFRQSFCIFKDRDRTTGERLDNTEKVKGKLSVKRTDALYR